ncbi:caax amino terminal protease [Halogeometricum borinquense DSM 11551]|uniref:Caax amino terminal protease n=1 Tax=Halogeometricum borinquense (strain ATCC 700274 / DSM 11551 / JCM 10706 / KCTC 4070 / PR3) TaxID=469382 RepID=E4NQZ6_HALBP|nr:CPBP family intramembrane glutamic endopeptidase [Halogeometricum borinquense]ADQ65622.1 CAAX amino terminal protease family [Halogeometricum borinquense DSM 11551]ELY27842.1 caax amino terminal protease [Halogeometricum borinquense DSM 11551]
MLTVNLRALVWNADERRPPAPVRLMLAVVALIVSVLLLGLFLSLFFTTTPITSASFGLSFVAILFPGVLAVGLAVVVDRRTIADLGFGFDRDWWIDLGFGLFLGAALMTAIFLVALAAGWVRVEGTLTGGSRGFLAGFTLLTIQFLAVGVSEEIVSRGYLLTNVAEGLSGYTTRFVAASTAVLFSSVVFGAAHLQNPNATLVSTVGISLAGIFLAIGYVLTDELAIPIGLHITWNLFQGGVYGFAVSGLGVSANVVDTVETGPDLFTGGAFGPEAGLLGVFAIILGTFLIIGYVRWRYGEARLAPGLFSPELRWRE